jgi:hypothetical protein
VNEWRQQAMWNRKERSRESLRVLQGLETPT